MVETIRPSSIVDIIHSAECLTVEKETKVPVKMECERCGSVSSNKLCKACLLIETLNKDKKSKTKQMAFEEAPDAEAPLLKPAAVPMAEN